MVLEEGENSGGSDTCLPSLGLGVGGEAEGALGGLRSVKGRVELGSGRQRGVKASEEGNGPLPPSRQAFGTAVLPGAGCSEALPCGSLSVLPEPAVIDVFWGEGKDG